MPDLASAIAHRFVERRDIKSWQAADGAYHIDRSRLTKRDVDTHLSGSRTLGHYVVSDEGAARVITFDVDVVKPKGPRDAWPAGTVNMRDEFLKPDSLYRVLLTKQLNAMGRALARRTHTLLDCHVAAAFSGNKGIHVYGFMGAGVPARDLREAARVVLDSFNEGRIRFVPSRGNNFFKLDTEGSFLEVEIYPKQDDVKDGSVGNLVRLPLGVNRKSGKPGFFIRFDTDGIEFVEMDALEALGGKLPW